MARFYNNISAKAYADALSVGLYGAAASSNVENAAAVAMGIAPSQLASTIPTNLQIWQAGIALAQSPLFTSTYPATLGDAAFITAVNAALTGSTFILADELASFQSVISQYSMTRAQAATYIVGVVMSVDPTTLGLNNQPNPANPGGVSDLQLFQNQQSAAYNRTLVSGNFANQSVNASNLNYPVAGPATNAGYIGASNADTGVTSVSSTVVTAQAQIAAAAAANNPALITGQAVPTDNISLTTNIETVPATGTLFVNQTVSGVSAAANGTFQTGDVINGGGLLANNVVNITGNGQATAGGELVTINNVTRVNTSLAQNTSLQAANWTGVGQSWVSNVTGAGNTATLINGALATTYGAYNTALATTYNIGLRAGDVTGTSSTLQLAASGAGATGNTFTINSTTATGVEGISFAGSGTNDVTLLGTVGAATDLVSLAITGAGVNTISTQGLTQLATVSAGTSTGTNVVNVGTSLVTGFTYTGGTGADTLRATTSGQVITGITLTGVETLRLDSGAANSTLTFSAPAGLTTVRLDTGTAGAVVKTLAGIGSFTNLNFVGTGTTAAAGNAMAFNGVTATGGFAGAADALAINFSNGGVTTTNAAPYTVGNINIAGVETFNINVADNTANAPLAMGTLTSSTLTTVNATSNGVVNTGVIDSGVANSNSIAAVNWSGVTGNAVSTITVGAAGNTLAAAATITAGAGGLNATVAGAEANTDVLTFTGGAGADTLTAAAFTGNIIGNGGGGIDTFTIGAAASSALSGGAANDTFTLTNGVATNTISDLGLGATAAALETLTATGGGTGVTATVVANFIDANAAGDTAIINLANAAALNVFNLAAGVTTFNASGNAGAGGVTVNATNAGVSTTLTGTGAADAITGSALADTIRGNAGADTLTGNGGVDTFIFTTAITADNVTDFSVATGEIAAFSVAALNAAGGAGAAGSTLVNGSAAAVVNGTGASLTAVAGATTLGTGNVLNVTGITFGNIAAVEAALEGGARALTTNANAIAANSTLLVQWVDNTNVTHLSAYVSVAGVAAATAFGAGSGTLADIATVGTTPLVAADFSFIA